MGPPRRPPTGRSTRASATGPSISFAVPAGGAITLTRAVTTVIAGLGYVPVVQTLPPQLALPSGDRKGLIKRLVRSLIDFHGPAARPTIDGVGIVDNAGAAISAWDGPYEMYHMGYDREPVVTLSQSAPLAPWRVLSVNQEVDV
jgi:hypothetical protein